MADISTWDAHDPAIWAEEVGSPPIAISLRHPSYPAEATCAADPGALRKIVAKYLTKVSARLGLPDLFATEDNFKVFMGWLDLPAGDGGVDPRKSFWVTRYEDPINRMGLIDRTVVFVAAESWRENDSAGVLGSRLGLRVVAHVAQQGSATWKVRITSVARSIGLPEALESHATLGPEATNFYSFVFTPANILSFKAFITSATGLDPDRVAIEGVRVSTVGNNTSGTIYATESRRDEDPPGPGYALTVRFTVPPGALFTNPTVERSPLVAHAAEVKANLFTQDPASRAGLGKLIESRPNRAPERLNAFKYPNVELEGLHFDVGDHCLLIDDDLALADVRQSKIVAATANPNNTQGVVPADVDHPGQNEFAALGGYEHTRAKFNQRHLRPLFTTLIAYGLPPHDYFRFARSPLRVPLSVADHTGTWKGRQDGQCAGRIRSSPLQSDRRDKRVDRGRAAADARSLRAGRPQEVDVAPPAARSRGGSAVELARALPCPSGRSNQQARASFRPQRRRCPCRHPLGPPVGARHASVVARLHVPVGVPASTPRPRGQPGMGLDRTSPPSGAVPRQRLQLSPQGV